jgi:hypothetical protein
VARVKFDGVFGMWACAMGHGMKMDGGKQQSADIT